MINVNVHSKSITAHVSQKSPNIDNSQVKVVKGERGAVFTPYVDDNSNLSWTNDGGLENPPTKNIRGRDGAAIQAITNFEIEKLMEG